MLHADFHALFSGIQSSAALGLKTRHPKGEDAHKGMSDESNDDSGDGEDPFN